MECPFGLNDKVMHPQYGAGYVINHQDKIVDGEKIKCLEIDTLFKKTKIFIPVDNDDFLGQISFSGNFRATAFGRLQTTPGKNVRL